MPTADFGNAVVSTLARAAFVVAQAGELRLETAHGHTGHGQTIAAAAAAAAAANVTARLTSTDAAAVTALVSACDGRFALHA